MNKQKLQAIATQYKSIAFNQNNYSIGGGLADEKFASRRHEEAKADKGKITKGQAVALFKKATNLSSIELNDLIDFVFPSLEWHHAGALPSKYGGGMKKTYFMNSEEIVELATNFEKHFENFEKYRYNVSVLKIKKMEKDILVSDFLKTHGTWISRVSEKPQNFYPMQEEMRGKFGWFEATPKYTLDIYYSGYIFASEQILNDFLTLKKQ